MNELNVYLAPHQRCTQLVKNKTKSIKMVISF